MHAFLSIYLFILALWIELFGIGKCFESAMYQRYSYFSPAKQVKLKSLAMRPFKNLTEAERRKNLSNCKGTGMVCGRAEDCCTMICLKNSKKCAYIKSILRKPFKRIAPFKPITPNTKPTVDWLYLEKYLFTPET